MIRPDRVRRTFLFALVAVMGCITVNVYFPAPEVRRAAEQIVEETWGGEAAAQPATPAAEQPHSALSVPSFVGVAYAAEVDVNVSTPAIRALKEQMKTRAEQLKPHLSAGHVGIAADGKLVVRNLDGVALRDQATVRRLVEAENNDREALYREITKANNFGSERIDEVRRIFAETWISKAERGWWVQQGTTWKQR